MIHSIFKNSLINRLIILKPVLVVIWSVFEAFSNFMDKLFQAIGVLILVGMLVLLFVNGYSRLTGDIPLGWTLEITGYMVAWSIFIMMGPITRSDEHIKVTFLPEKVLGGKRGVAFIHTLENLVGIIVCVYLSFQSYRLVEYTYNSRLDVESAGGWDYPMWIIRSGLMIGFCSAALYYFERIVKSIIHFFTVSEVVPGGDSPILSGTQEEEGR